MGKLVKVRLLNNGGYNDTFADVNFPVEVIGRFYTDGFFVADDLIVISRDEITNIHGAAPAFKGDDLSFYVGTECEIIND